MLGAHNNFSVPVSLNGNWIETSCDRCGIEGIFDTCHGIGKCSRILPPKTTIWNGKKLFYLALLSFSLHIGPFNVKNFANVIPLGTSSQTIGNTHITLIKAICVFRSYRRRTLIIITLASSLLPLMYTTFSDGIFLWITRIMIIRYVRARSLVI